MSSDSWPSPDARRGPLPRIEDLPIGDHGYDQEATRRAFDDFYRHVAQLDATLKTLEAVEAFQRDAAELRTDLRSLRALGLGTPASDWEARSWPVERERPEISTTALRIAGEAALLIVVAVLVGIANVRPLVIVAVMAAALGIVWLCELLAARSRTRVPSWINEPYGFGQVLPPAEPIEELGAGEPAPYIEAALPDPAVGWSAFEGEGEVEVVEVLEEAREEAREEDHAQDLQEGEQSRGWLRRRRAKEEVAEEPVPGTVDPAVAAAEAAPVGHVRVLKTGFAEDPWERGFDGEDADGAAAGNGADEQDVRFESSDPRA